MVGAVRFELTTSCTRNKRASQATLRPDPGKEKVPVDAAISKKFVAFAASRLICRPNTDSGIGGMPIFLRRNPATLWYERSTVAFSL
jgi:hypothetical protein